MIQSKKKSKTANESNYNQAKIFKIKMEKVTYQ